MASNTPPKATIQQARNGQAVGEPVDLDSPAGGEAITRFVRDMAEDFPNLFNIMPPTYPESGGPYVYVAHRRTCKCPVAVHPFGVDGKAAGVALAEWVKSGWMIATVSKKYGVSVGVCHCKPVEERGEPAPLAYIGQRVCGCTESMNVIPFDKASATGAGKIIQVWAGENKVIQTVEFCDVFINDTCPHVKPKEKQATLPGMGTADNGED